MYTVVIEYMTQINIDSWERNGVGLTSEVLRTEKTSDYLDLTDLTRGVFRPHASTHLLSTYSLSIHRRLDEYPPSRTTLPYLYENDAWSPSATSPAQTASVPTTK